MSVFHYKTPCYIIDSNIFSHNLSAFQNTFSQYWEGNVSFGYSIKTNHSPTFLRLAKSLGMYAESVSDDEYQASILAGYPANKIIYNGPQKTGDVLTSLFSTESIINIDNFSDIIILRNYISTNALVKAKVGLRVNFDIDRTCPGEMTAGSDVSRFGFCVENGDLATAISELHALGIPISGLHMHYSSKTRSERVFRELSRMAASLVKTYSLCNELCYIDIGGGFFYGNNIYAQNKPSLNVYAQTITTELKKILSPQKVELILEPGAALVSSAVTYYTKVINQRFIRGVKILTVDGSRLHIDPFMTGRKVLYDINLSQSENRTTVPKQIICGSTCMENDRIVYLDDHLEMNPGDILRFPYVGAYTMGFNCCFINLPPHVYLKENHTLQLVRSKDRTLLTQI